ncbi:hypothetical protein SERLA73DRAFT_69726 [Serpula lacrymans var. lacrymans S7.3]|uniref:Cytochrome P450 n=1 Tax=Serpula lacrymans var. lacrymans (strain S7.3) TaxID=936435 RepID=F8PKU9_SERL3|nr:hypothetical protein SERLA73DRAFT_69726 [Serpula lacrymans var. lacrymans S7.3]
MDTPYMTSIKIQDLTVWWTISLLALTYLLHRFLAVSSHLRHLPALPIFSITWSYICQEPDDVRFKRLIIPYANKHSEGVVLVWIFGQWTVHVVDPQIVYQVNGNITNFPKDIPPWDLLLIRFTGRSNIAMRNGEEWKSLSTIIREAFTTPIPIELFASLAKNLFHVINQTPLADDKGLKVRWNGLSQRFTLDAVGYSVLGYNVDAISTQTQFVKDYNMFMHYTNDPLYLALPIFEKIITRKHAFELVETLKKRLVDMLLAKRMDPGDDIVSFLLRDPSLTVEELRDNLSTLLIAGHDTTAGAISTIVYHLAVNQTAQQNARNEVIREALRIISPSSYGIPRMSQMATNLSKYYVPPNTAVVSNICGVHHSETVWSDFSGQSDS